MSLNRLFALLALMVVGMALWTACFYYFRTDGRGHLLREAESPAAEARGQQLLGRADALTNRRQYDAAQALLDSLRNADANPAVFIADNDLEQRFDTLRQRRYRARLAQQGR